jgi:glycosyltransferase involved in cell wall biosynthesis
MQLPSVTVIVPAYNAAGTLRACLTSVRASDYDGRVEIIVVDDCSTDQTRAIAKDLGCRVICRGANGGPARARNAGARAATGDILLFLDADTEMRLDTIRVAVRALNEEGVGAVSGMYEAEPINPGFFPAYYAYLKYYAFMANDSNRVTVFSGQCGAVYKRLFEQVGGYRSIAWGVDIENEELGYRLNQCSAIALCRDFRVRHNFPTFRKLMFVFTNRVYWWILFRHFSKRDEAVLMTRGFGYATAAMPGGALCLLAALLVQAAPWSSLLGAAALLLVLLFARGYQGFWRLGLRRRGPGFALASVLASAFFSFVVTAGAARGFLSIGRLALARRALPFAQAARGEA